MAHNALALKLRVLRAEKGWTIEKAAEQAKVMPETISDAERGRRHPYLPTLRKLAAGYEVPIEELLVEEEEPAVAGKAQATQGSGLLAKAKDAARRDMRRESQAIQRSDASGGLPQSVSGYEEDEVRAELRSLGFEEGFEKVLWPAVQEAVEKEEEIARLREENARLREAPGETAQLREVDR